jgi:molybdate transport system regulatory protein
MSGDTKIATVAGPEIRPSLQFAFGPDRRLGPGKIALLEGIIATGSISAAGRGMGMSYRRAWLLVDALNRMFAEPVVVAAAGGARGGGAQVTETGRRLVATYRAIEKRTLRDARASFAEFAFRDETPASS